MSYPIPNIPIPIQTSLHVWLKVLSIIYFFNFMVSILFHLGTMTWLVSKLGWLLQVTTILPCDWSTVHTILSCDWSR